LKSSQQPNQRYASPSASVVSVPTFGQSTGWSRSDAAAVASIRGTDRKGMVIAARMRLSPHSVHAYAKVIYQRLSVTSRPELMARYVGRPLFNPELLQAGS